MSEYFLFWETGLIFWLSAAVAFLLWQPAANQRYQNNTGQYNKIIMSLLDYRGSQFTLEDMLERCLAIIVSEQNQNCFCQGAIFLQQNNTLNCIAQSAGVNVYIDDYLEHLLNFRLNEGLDYHFIPGHEEEYRFPHMKTGGQYIIPLEGQGKIVGVLLLVTHSNYTPTDIENYFLRSLSQVVACLVERKKITDELRLGSSVFELSQQAIFITDQDNRIIRCNKACEQITGFSNDELKGQNPKIFRSDYQTPYFYQNMWQKIQVDGFWQGEIWNKHKNGTVFAEWLTISSIKDADNRVIQYLAIFTDLTNIKNAEQDIRQLAFYDPLTQLPNRTLFNDRIQQSISQAERYNNQFALLCLDIDNFKNINDSLGHQAGDKLLQEIAGIIQQTLHEEDSIARIGGDEFAIIIHNLTDRNNSKVVHVVGKILSSLSKPVQLAGHEIIVTGSIGISFYPDDADNAIDLVKYADTAMFQAKKAGRNSYQFYTEKFNQQALRKIQLETALRQALKQNDFLIFLQPQLHLGSMIMTGAEVLLRVGSGQLQKVSPAEYIPVAEETGLIVEIGDWVFAEVCQLLCSWYDQQLLPNGFKRIAINISPQQFKRHDFVNKIQQCIQQTGVPVQYIELELTESSLQESTHSVINKLIALKSMGINIAIDDFGTGYSSLSRLKQFPIDLLKIDRSFVNDLCVNQSDLAIIKAIINMAQALKIKTLAEGVETEAQLNILKTLQCNYSQGFLHSRPMDRKLFTQNLADMGSNQTISKLTV